MNLNIMPYREQYFEDCVSALKNSDLGVHYFTSDGSAEKAIMEGADSGTMYVAVSNERFLGFVYYLPQGAFHSFPYIHLLVVKPSARGNGVGTQLLQSIEKIVEREKLFLVVADFNPDAQRLYERLGFVQVGTIESLYRNGITEKLMMKKLEKGA